MADELPRTFGKYILERRLGVGGMAETFVARREGKADIVQHVCLKRVLPAFNEDNSFREQFQREAKLAARLRHMNIVGTIDYGSVGTTQYMAIELVDGVDLRELLQNQPGTRLAPDVVAWIGMELAHALEYAHRSREKDEGIVHRDVTPSNVLLSIEGEVKLADFGVAKAIGTATVMTATGIMKGKIPYMPPEQMTRPDIDGRVDLFSLGVLMYESLAGRRPFVGVHDVMVMTAILAGERPPLLELAPDTPPLLAEAIEKLLAIDRDERVPSATALVDLLAPVVPTHAIKKQLSALVRSAYGEEVHSGAASDTAFQESVELPGGHDPAAFADTHPKQERERAFGRTLIDPASVDPAASVDEAGAHRAGADHAPDAPAPDEAPTPTEEELGESVTSDQQPARATIRNMAEEAAAAMHAASPPGTRMGLGPSAADEETSGAHQVTTGETEQISPPEVDPHTRVVGGTGGSDTLEVPRAPATSRRLPALAAAAVLLLGAGAGAAIFMAGEETPPIASTAPRTTEQVEQPLEAAPVDDPPELPVGVDPPEDLPEDPQPETTEVEHAAMRETSTTVGTAAAMTGSMAEPDVTSPETTPMTTMAERDPEPGDMRSPERLARYNITVLPWGKVWVGSAYMGRAPVEIRLAPGTHVVRVGRDRPTQRRRITVRSPRDGGELEFDLSVDP